MGFRVSDLGGLGFGIYGAFRVLGDVRMLGAEIQG